MIARTTQRRALFRAVVVFAGVCCLALNTGAGARAAAPSQFQFTETESFTDTTSCSFPIEVSYTDTVMGREYFDNAGNSLGYEIHHDVIGTDTANDITLKEADHSSEHIDSLGASKEVGLSIHMQAGGGGLVIRDAGLLFLNPDRTIAYMHGQHPFLLGDTAALCAAFS
jgi:hypothetical protein